MRIESVAYNFICLTIRRLSYRSLCTFQASCLLHHPHILGAGYLGCIHVMMLREFAEWAVGTFLEVIPVPAWPTMRVMQTTEVRSTKPRLNTSQLKPL